jgi:hypothetical protein
MGMTSTPESINIWNTSDHLKDENDILLYLGAAADEDDDDLLALAKKNVAVARERHRKEYQEERTRLRLLPRQKPEDVGKGLPHAEDVIEITRLGATK